MTEKDEVGTCCPGKEQHEMCPTCKEEYETWKQSKGSDKDYSRIKKRLKLKKWEESPYTKQAIKLHQKKMREMDIKQRSSGVNVSKKPEPNKLNDKHTSSEDVWPRGASWQNKTLTKSAVESFIEKAKKAFLNSSVRQAYENLIKEDDNEESKKDFAERRDAMFRAKYKLPSKEQIEIGEKQKQAKKEAGNAAYSGPSTTYTPEYLQEKPASQVEHEKALIRDHERRMEERKQMQQIAANRPNIVIRRGASGNDAAIPHLKPGTDLQPQLNQKPRQAPAELSDEEKARLEELLHNVAMSQKRKS